MRVALREVVEEPVGDQPARHPLDGDGQVAVRRRRTGHGVRAQLLVAVDVDPEGAELPGPVAEGLVELGGDVEDEGAGVVGLGDDPGDPERVVAVLAAGRGRGRSRHGRAAYWGVGHATDLVSRYWSNPASPFWRPIPLCL